MDNWADMLVEESATIRDALMAIDKGACKTAFVVDATQRLKGVLTDGDIRRALIRGKSLADPITGTFVTTPKTLMPGYSKGEADALLEAGNFLALPIVDASSKLVGVHTFKDRFLAKQHDNPVFIMAGGFGSRLKPLTDACPKPMLKIGDKPMLEHVISQFKSHGFHRFYISTHYLPHVIRDYFGDGSRWGVSIVYVHEEEPLGTGGALSLLPDDVPELPLLMINGDILTKINFAKLLDFHSSGEADATMCVREYEYQVPYGVIESEGPAIIAMVEKPVQRFFINAGVYVINPQIYKNMKAHTRIDMPSLLEQKMAEGGKVHRFIIHDYWLDIGHLPDFERAQVDIKLLDF